MGTLLCPCGSFWDGPIWHHKATKCPRSCIPPLLWDSGAGTGLGNPQRSRSPWAPGVFCLVLPRSPAAWWVMGFLIIPNKYKPGGWIMHDNNSPANINIPLLVIKCLSLSSPLNMLCMFPGLLLQKFCKALVSVCFPLNCFQIPICRVCWARSELCGRKRRWVEQSP